MHNMRRNGDWSRRPQVRRPITHLHIPQEKDAKEEVPQLTEMIAEVRSVALAIKQASKHIGVPTANRTKRPSDRLPITAPKGPGPESIHRHVGERLQSEFKA